MVQTFIYDDSSPFASFAYEFASKERDSANLASAKFGDLLLIITRHGGYWRAHVEEIDDPDGGLSDGTDYANPERAKSGAATIARELFGTNVPEEQLEWR